jgi:hypothetical protein
MSKQATVTIVDEQEVICNHKPGDVWADGCCTSQKTKKATTEDEGGVDTLASSDVADQSVEPSRDVTQ